MYGKDSTLGSRIRAQRKSKGKTLKELGAAVNVTESAMSHYENDRRPLKIDMIRKIAAALNVTVSELIYPGLSDSKNEQTMEHTNERINTILDMLSQYPDSIGSQALDHFVIGLSGLSVIKPDELKWACLESLYSIVRFFGEAAVHGKTMGSEPESLPNSYIQFLNAAVRCQDELQAYINTLKTNAFDLSGENPELYTLLYGKPEHKEDTEKDAISNHTPAAAQEDTDAKEGD